MSRIIKSPWVSQPKGVVRIPDAEPIPLSIEAEAITPESYQSVVEKAREEGRLVASEIVQQAMADRDAMILQAQRDAEEIRRQAYEDGLRQGLEEKREEIESCVTDVCMQVASLCAEHEEYMMTYEHELRDFAVDIAEKIIGVKIQTDSAILERLVMQAVRSVRNADWISVEISESLPQLVEFLERELEKKDFGNTRVEIVGQDTPPGSILLQTSEGVVDASVSTQLYNLRALFKDMDLQPEE